jgi:hypothetical protein
MENKYIAKLFINNQEIYCNLSTDLPRLITRTLCYLEAENSSASALIVDGATNEVIYRCRKAAQY